MRFTRSGVNIVHILSEIYMEEAQNPLRDSQMIIAEEAECEEIEQLRHQRWPLEKCQSDEKVLQLLDSLDNYINQLDSLSATLRQGWLELASARHSMGVSRLNSSLLDLKIHSASTFLCVTDGHDSTLRRPHFSLQKFAPADVEEQFNEEKLHRELVDSPQLRQRATSKLSGKVEQASAKKEESIKASDSVGKERAKLLSMFGTFVSPKLRAAQFSFETAIETLVEIANERASILSAFDQVKKEIDGNTD